MVESHGDGRTRRGRRSEWLASGRRQRRGRPHRARLRWTGSTDELGKFGVGLDGGLFDRRPRSALAALAAERGAVAGGLSLLPLLRPMILDDRQPHCEPVCADRPSYRRLGLVGVVQSGLHRSAQPSTHGDAFGAGRSLHLGALGCVHPDVQGQHCRLVPATCAVASQLAPHVGVAGRAVTVEVVKVCVTVDTSGVALPGDPQCRSRRQRRRVSRPGDRVTHERRSGDALVRGSLVQCLDGRSRNSHDHPCVLQRGCHMTHITTVRVRGRCMVWPRYPWWRYHFHSDACRRRQWLGNSRWLPWFTCGMSDRPSGPGADVNEQGAPWWFPPNFVVDPELLAAGAETQRRIRELTDADDGQSQLGLDG